MSTPPDPSAASRAGTWYQRLLIAAFGVLLALLLYWLLGFVVDDLGSLRGPDYRQLEAEMLDSQLLSTRDSLARQIADAQRSMANEQSRQRLLRESTNSSQTTLNQLLDIQRMSLQQNTQLSDQQQQALADSAQLFLRNQEKDQQLSESISTFSEQINGLQEQQRTNDQLLEEQRKPVQKRFEQQTRAHGFRVASLKLSFLVPLLLIAAGLFMRQRGSIYSPLIYAFGGATLVKTFVVMHDHFPARYFKYILVLTSITAVVATLIYLLRSRHQPSRDALLKQYREAYETFVCPVCSFPIRRGPLRFAFWNRRSIKRLQIPPERGDDTPYTCPACGTALFEACGDCGMTRHTLLPACVGCGATREPA